VMDDGLRATKAETIPPRPRLRLQALTLLVGNIGYAASQAAILFILAKLTSPVALGQFGLGVAIAAPLLVLAGFQLRSLQAVGLSKSAQFGDYLGLRLLSLIVVLAAIAVAAWLGHYSHETHKVLMAVGLAKCADSLAEVVYGYAQGIEMVGRIAVSLIAKSILSTTLLVIAVSLTKSVFWAALALCLSSVLVFIVCDLRTARLVASAKAELPASLVPRVKPRTVWEIARLGFPLGVTSMLIVLAYNIPRYFLQHRFGEAAVGYFAALSFPFACFSFLLGALGQAATPRMSSDYVHCPREFWRSVRALCMVPIVTCLAALTVSLALGPRLLILLFNQDYAGYFSAFVVLLIAGGCWSVASALGYAATASGRIAGQVPATAATCAAAVVLSPFLIPRDGVLGAAAVYLAGGLVHIATFVVLVFSTSSAKRKETVTTTLAQTESQPV
jgi:O-antigen/teichoic acid export membrane protein